MFFKVRKSDKSVLGYDTIQSENLSNSDAQTVTSQLLDFTTIKINCNNGFLEYIALPACSDKELYFHETESEIILSDSIYTVAGCMAKVSDRVPNSQQHVPPCSC